MTSEPSVLPDDSQLSLPSLEPTAPNESTPPRETQVRLKAEAEHLLLLLPAEAEDSDQAAMNAVTWNDLCEQLRYRLNAGQRFWQPGIAVHVLAKDRLLDLRQLQEMGDILTDAQLQLKRIYTSRRQTAIAAVSAGYSVEQQTLLTPLTQPEAAAEISLADPLYLQTTVRSGIEICHPGTVVILGDLNPGSSVIAEGDIMVWGSLRGLAHAGAKGNAQCRIMALQMKPTQIRIADYVARAPEQPPAQYYPEVAYVTPQGIRITRATDFSKPFPPLAVNGKVS